ncbi:MAG: lamin tail domain-containing protein, partial [Anaeromyxobacteraceae bacterium]
RAEIVPDGPLEPLSAYAVVVGTGVRSVRGPLVLDPTGRKRAFATVFRTGPMPDRVPPAARWLSPPHGPVPVNLKELRVGFSEAVTGSLSVKGVAGRARSVAPDVLALALDAPLPAGTLAPLLDDVRDGGDNRPAPLPAIAVASCRDDRPPVVGAGTIRILAADTSVTAAAEASEVARLGLEVAAERTGEDCGSLPPLPATLVAWGDFTACPGHDPCGAAARCPVAVRVPGLCPGRRVRVRVLAEDLAGNAAAPGEWMTAATGAPVARLALTEVLADASTPQAGGEYVEVANLGSGDADLTGHHLAKRSASGAVSRCTLEPQGGTLPAGAHGLVVGGGWDGRYKVPAGVPLFRCGATSLAGGLADDRAPALALESPSGAVLSGLGWAAPGIRCAGRSIERVHPEGEDATANLACAAEAPGTPGACNGSTPPAECPRRSF